MVNLLIFIDESGDLGFKDKSTSYFIVAYVIVNSNDVYKIDKEIRDLHRDIHKTTKKRFDEFKYTKDLSHIKRRFIEIIPRLPIQIGYVCIKDKNRIKPELRDEPVNLYNYLTIHYSIYNMLIHYNNINNLTLVIDKSITRKQQEYAKDYFNTKLSYLTSFLGLKTIPNAVLTYKDSKDERCLQLADYIAGILKDKHMHNKDGYYNIIKGKILFEIIW